tara:strand:+ start:2173 stop:2385 length:213 start_codon:yes stop_codon:yes gene_type:complete
MPIKHLDQMYKSRLLYLGQLELNIHVTEGTLSHMKLERDNVIIELKLLEKEIGNATKSQPPTATEPPLDA